MNPITRIGGLPCITGTRIPTSTVHAFHADGYEPWAIQKEYPSLTIDQIEFAIAYERKRAQRAARKANDPKRPHRLAGKRNARNGRIAEEWVTTALGGAWKRRGGAGRVDVEYVGTAAAPIIRTIEVKRRAGADKTLRMHLVQNGVDALVRYYGREPGVRQTEPTVVMRWSVWRQLVQAAGQEIGDLGTAVRGEGEG